TPRSYIPVPPPNSPPPPSPPPTSPRRGRDFETLRRNWEALLKPPEYFQNVSLPPDELALRQVAQSYHPELVEAVISELEKRGQWEEAEKLRGFHRANPHRAGRSAHQKQ